MNQEEKTSSIIRLEMICISMNALLLVKQLLTFRRLMLNKCLFACLNRNSSQLEEYFYSFRSVWISSFESVVFISMLECITITLGIDLKLITITLLNHNWIICFGSWAEAFNFSDLFITLDNNNKDKHEKKKTILFSSRAIKMQWSPSVTWFYEHFSEKNLIPGTLFGRSHWTIFLKIIFSYK